MRRRLLATLLALAISPVTLAADLPESIRVIYVKAPFNLQNIVMREHELLEKEFSADGVRIEWRDITSGAKQGQGMASGHVDIATAMNTASLLMANASGNPVRIVSGMAHPGGIFGLVGRQGINDMESLRGKKVAGPRGTVLHQLLVAALREHGMCANDVKFVPMGIQAAMASVVAGRVDAALLAGAPLIRARQAGCKQLTDTKRLLDLNLVTAVRADFASRYPQVLERYVQVQKRAQRWIAENPEQAVRLGAKCLKMPESLARELFAGVEHYTELTTRELQALERDNEFLFANGLTRRRVNVKQLPCTVSSH